MNIGNTNGFRKGYIPWNKDKEFSTEHKKNLSKSRLKRKEKLGYINSIETRKKMSMTRTGDGNGFYGKHHTTKTLEIMSIRKLGILFSEEHKIKISIALKGEKSYLWEGGVSFEPYSIDWTDTLKKAIRERDCYICQVCSEYGNTVHHIDYNKKNGNSNNLITLCVSCHIKTNKNREYWKNYFTTKQCSNCGNIQKMPLWIRTYKCLSCGFEIDRDLNSAINIKSKFIGSERANVENNSSTQIEQELSMKQEAITSTGVRL
jgi:hypothetical protein